MSCIICEHSKSTVFYNFHSTTTMHTITPLKDFCLKIFSIPFEGSKSSDELICECCFDVITELDEMEKKSKELRNELKRKYYGRQDITINGEIVLETLFYTDSSVNVGETSEEHKLKDNGKLSHSKITKVEHLDHTLNGKSAAKIHFSNENDLRNILDVQLFNKKNELSDWEEGSPEIKEESVLYDMMDDRNIEMHVEEKLIEIPKKTIQCRKCMKVFNTREELKSHGETHSNDTPFICEICGKVYRHKTALNIHVGMHNGINPFKCLYCNKTFTQKGALIRHVKIHTGEKPFQCDECGKCFTHHTSFNVHKISHSGEKSYKCEVCGLALISTSHLKRHMRVHTGERKFSCPICGKRFAERYNLVSHSKLHTNGTLAPKSKKFRCESCNINFLNRFHLEEHLLECQSSTDGDKYSYA